MSEQVKVPAFENQRIERRMGQPVVTAQNAAQLNALVADVIEAIAAPMKEEQ